MKSNTFKGFVAGTLALMLLAPALAHAQDSRRTTPRTTSATFCDRIAAFGPKLDENMYKREVRLLADRAERAERMSDKWEKRDMMLAEKRTLRDENVDKHLEKLEEKAATDAQKAAIVAFKEAHSRALADRKAAVDAATKTYREGIQAMAGGQKEKSDALIRTFKSAVDAAYAKAKADCAAGVPAETVKASLVEALRAAKAAHYDGRAELDKAGDIVRPLIEARNAAYKKAFADFKAAIEKAKEDLRSAFPKTDR